VNLVKHSKSISAITAIVLWFGGLVYGGTATNITGLFYTGVDNSGTVLAGGAQDSHWSVSYANVNGTGSTSSAYTGAAYVLSSSYIDAAYVPNTSTSKWITAPGASTAASGGTTNIGGDYLPGNGTTGANSAYFVYKLAFTITGTGGAGSTATNQVSISLTVAADDQYSVYVNPSSAPTVNANTGAINTGGTAASGGGTSAWNNTSSITLQNYGSGSANNANFVIGTNYLYVVVANTNSQTGTNGSNALNPSGLLVYQVGSANLIDGKPVPEVGTWLPVVAALGVFGWRRMKRSSRPEAAA
jgi:hypothetical protein